MNTVLVVAADDARRTRLQRSLASYSVFAVATDTEALKLVRLLDVDIAVIDPGEGGRGAGAMIAALKEAAPGTLTVLIGADDETQSLADFTVRADFSTRDVEAAVERAADKHRLVRELTGLRARAGAPATELPPANDPPWDGATLARVLKEFTRAFAAGFDLPRVLDTFLDAIGELVRPTRMALLMPTEGGEAFRVAAHRGLPPPIVESVHLPAATGLLRRLATEGRPTRRQDIDDPAVGRELELVQGVVAVPLLSRAELVAALVLGQPVVRRDYGPHEIATLFDLATPMATSLREIALHHQLQREKEFSERILAHMSNGVVTIGRDHRVGTMNRRAEQILGVAARDVVGHDLRALPSPLGDMLYATLASGQSTARSEVQLALRGLSLEVSTYPIQGDEPLPLGAVLVFEDLTAQKELLAQKRQAEQRELLTSVVARIADEIKNPLVSINTFVELIEERFDEGDFRKHFSTVVRRDVRRLVEVFEKLAGLVSDGELHFSTVDVHAVVDELAASIQSGDEIPGRRLELDVIGESGAPAPLPVRTDPAQFRKALSYLVWYLASNSPDPARVSISAVRHAEQDGTDMARVLVGSRTAQVAAPKLHTLFDPVQMAQESLIHVGPAISQRIVEALGGELRLRQGRHELAFLVTLPIET